MYFLYYFIWLHELSMCPLGLKTECLATNHAYHNNFPKNSSNTSSLKVQKLNLHVIMCSQLFSKHHLVKWVNLDYHNLSLIMFLIILHFHFTRSLGTVYSVPASILAFFHRSHNNWKLFDFSAGKTHTLMQRVEEHTKGWKKSWRVEYLRNEPL